MKAALKQAIAALEANRNTEQAMAMEAYLKNKFPMLGIKTPERKAILKTYLTRSELRSDPEGYIAMVPLLWAMEEREFQYTALFLLEQLQKYLTLAHLPLLKNCITQKSWWDTVDLLAAKNIGGLMKGEDLFNSPVNEWIYSDDMWLNRTAILVQLKYKQKTDLKFLTKAIIPHLESKVFFHQKAIGWALREYGKTDPLWVKEFCENNPLKPLSRREALRLLQE